MTVRNSSSYARRHNTRQSELDVSLKLTFDGSRKRRAAKARISISDEPGSLSMKQGRSLRSRYVPSNVVSRKERTRQAPTRSNTRSSAQIQMTVQNNDLLTNPTNRTSTGADKNGDNVAPDADITSLTASTDGLSPSAPRFSGYGPLEQLTGHGIILAYWQVSDDKHQIMRVRDGRVATTVIQPLVADILWLDLEWQEHLFLMRDREINDPHVCIATYIRNGLLHAPRPNESNEACDGCFERRSACTCVEACSFCIDARRQCARFLFDDKDHKGVIVLAGLPEKDSSDARGVPYLRLQKDINNKGYFVQGL